MLSLKYEKFKFNCSTDRVENDDLLVRTEGSSQNDNGVIATTIADINMNKKREAFIINDGSIHLVTNKVIL